MNMLRWLVAAAAVLATGCTETRSYEQFRPEAEGLPMLGDAVPRLKFQELRRFGTAAGPLAFTGVGAVAVSKGGELAVVDDGLCQIVLIELQTGLPRSRLGQCGDGPGEFRRIRSIDFFESQLVVLEVSSQSIIWLDSTGREERRLRPNVYDEPGLSFIARVEQLDDSTLGAALVLNPTTGAPPRLNTLIAIIDSRDGSTRRLGVEDVDRSSTNPGTLARSAESCVLGEYDSAQVAVLNHWAFEGLLLDPATLEQTAHFLTDVPWSGSREIDDGDGTRTWRARTIPVSIACSPSLMLLAQTHSNFSAGETVREGAYYELRNRAGELLAAAEVASGDSSSIAFSRPAAIFGDRVLARSNPRDGIPQVLEFLMVY